MVIKEKSVVQTTTKLKNKALKTPLVLMEPRQVIPILKKEE